MSAKTDKSAQPAQRASGKGKGHGQGKKGHPRTSWKPAYLASLAICGVYKHAAADARVSFVTVWQARKTDPGFAAAEKEAEGTADAALEDEARRRAITGCRQYKFNRDGSPVFDPRTGEQYFEYVFSDTLLLALLKARLPAKYRESSLLTVENVGMPDERLAAHIAGGVQLLQRLLHPQPVITEGGK